MRSIENTSENSMLVWLYLAVVVVVVLVDVAVIVVVVEVVVVEVAMVEVVVVDVVGDVLVDVLVVVVDVVLVVVVVVVLVLQSGTHHAATFLKRTSEISSPPGRALSIAISAKLNLSWKEGLLVIAF